ncbi:MAG TPA: hypothetical protein VFV64_01685 [Permianibacter sp.]|nr:hypothetical protein [Permianibacter sp.]
MCGISLFAKKGTTVPGHGGAKMGGSIGVGKCFAQKRQRHKYAAELLAFLLDWRDHSRRFSAGQTVLAMPYERAE